MNDNRERKDSFYNFNPNFISSELCVSISKNLTGITIYIYIFLETGFSGRQTKQRKDKYGIKNIPSRVIADELRLLCVKWCTKRHNRTSRQSRFLRVLAAPLPILAIG